MRHPPLLTIAGVDWAKPAVHSLHTVLHRHRHAGHVLQGAGVAPAAGHAAAVQPMQPMQLPCSPCSPCSGYAAHTAAMQQAYEVQRACVCMRLRSNLPEMAADPLAVVFRGMLQGCYMRSSAG
eukprot:366450-Chlamydomonas_euryale.AAC.28